MVRRRCCNSLVLFLILLLVASLLVACGPAADRDASLTALPSAGRTATAVEPGSPAASVGAASPVARAEEFPITVTRSDGKPLTIERPPQRIVSLSAGGTELFFAVGAGEQLVAAEKYSDYPPEANELPKLDSYRPDPEAIVASDPDLVLVDHDADGIVAKLDELGVPALYWEVPTSIDGVIEEVRLIGRITGQTEEAEELATSMKARIDAITGKLADVEQGPRLYHELDPTFFTVSPESFVGDLYTLLKAQNIAAGGDTEYPQLSKEMIIERNPEVIVVATGPGEGRTTAEDVKARPGWDVISAVKNDRVYEINEDIVSRPGPRVVDGLEHVATLLYPERFASSHVF